MLWVDSLAGTLAGMPNCWFSVPFGGLQQEIADDFPRDRNTLVLVEPETGLIKRIHFRASHAKRDLHSAHIHNDHALGRAVRFVDKEGPGLTVTLEVLVERILRDLLNVPEAAFVLDGNHFSAFMRDARKPCQCFLFLRKTAFWATKMASYALDTHHMIKLNTFSDASPDNVVKLLFGHPS